MNPDPTTSTALREQLLAKIAREEVSMKPRTTHIARMLLVASVGFVTLLLSVAVVNFISFTVRMSSHASVLNFGPRGWELFLSMFPWELLVLDIALLAVLEWLLRRFRFGYRSPVLYSLFVFLVVIIAGGVALDRGTRINDDFLLQADRHELPGVFGEFYEHTRRPTPSGIRVCDCIVTAIRGTTIDAVEADDDQRQPLTIELPPGDPVLKTLAVGDHIVVAGDSISTTIRAFGSSISRHEESEAQHN